MNSITFQADMVVAIIFLYLTSCGLWLLMAIANLKWRVTNASTGLLISFMWIVYAYRNYKFFVLSKTPINHDDFMLNFYCTLALTTSFFFLAMPYFKHYKNFILKMFR